MVLDSYTVSSTNIGTLLCPQSSTSFHYFFNLPRLLIIYTCPTQLTHQGLYLNSPCTHTLCSLVHGPCRSLCLSFMQLGQHIFDLLLIIDWDHSSAHSHIVPDWIWLFSHLYYCSSVLTLIKMTCTWVLMCLPNCNETEN